MKVNDKVIILRGKNKNRKGIIVNIYDNGYRFVEVRIYAKIDTYYANDVRLITKLDKILS